MSDDFQSADNHSNEMKSGETCVQPFHFDFSLANSNNLLASIIKERLNALPEPVKKRIKALKKIQFETTKIESKFQLELYALELKYHNLYKDLYEKRETIVNGKYEPTDEESTWTLDDDLDKELDSKLQIKDITNKTDEESEKFDDNVKGIPEFWLHVMKNAGVLSEIVQEHDEPILKHLTDIKIQYMDGQMGFILEFHFSPNEYFRNTVLTKEYLMKCTPDEEDPFSFDGAEIYKCSGCTIDWHKDKNVTQRKVIKVQKHKSSGVTRNVTKTVHNESFFNFFSPPIIPDDDDIEVDDDTKAALITDFQIGHYIREHVIPRAVLYYLGEIDDDEDFDEEDDEEDEDDENEEELEDEEAGTLEGGKHINNPAECKQQ